MNCEKAVETILSNGERSKELDLHLSDCPSCAKLARQWEAFRGLRQKGGATPPMDTDMRICAAAIAKAHAIKKRRFAFRIIALASSAAAIIALSSAVVLGLQSQPKSQEGPAIAANAGTAAQANGVKQIAWDNVSLDEGLLKLSSDIENATSALKLGVSSAANSSAESQDEFPVLSVEILDITNS